MPGLAEILLGGLVGITGFLSHLSGLAGPLITVTMAFEEFNRWGGLAATVLTKLGLASAELTGGAFSFERFGSVLKGFASVIPMAVSGISALASRFALLMGTLSMASGEGAMASIFGSMAIGAAKLTGSLGGAAAAMRDFIAGLSAGAITGLAALAAGIGFLIYKAVTATSVIQDMGNAMQKSVMNASNTAAMSVAINNIGTLSQKLSQVKANETAATAAAQGNATAMARVGVIYKNSSDQYNAALKTQTQDMQNVAQGAAYLAKTYGTTFVGALALADQANVKLANGILGTSQAAMVARMQFASLVQGYQSMGQSSGEVGADMTALAIQAGLAGSQVGKLNSAWDQFQTNLTGGTAALVETRSRHCPISAPWLRTSITTWARRCPSRTVLTSSPRHLRASAPTVPRPGRTLTRL